MLSADKGSFIIPGKTGQKHEKTRKEEESEMFARKKRVVWKWWHFLVWEKICLRDRGNGRCHSSGQFYLASSLCPFRFFLCTDWFDYRFWSSNSFLAILSHRVGKNVSKIVLCSLILLFIVVSRNGIAHFLPARVCEQIHNKILRQNFWNKCSSKWGGFPPFVVKEPLWIIIALVVWYIYDTAIYVATRSQPDNCEARSENRLRPKIRKKWLRGATTTAEQIVVR